MSRFVYSDGGRSKYFKGTAGDCAVRALSIVTGKDYKEVYDLVNSFTKVEKLGKRHRGSSDARTGVHTKTFHKIAEELGLKWVATMKIGSGCKVHLRKEELPKGRIICNVSKHFVAVIDGVIHDTYDPSRDGTRCVYGYWIKK